MTELFIVMGQARLVHTADMISSRKDVNIEVMLDSGNSQNLSEKWNYKYKVCSHQRAFESIIDKSNQPTCSKVGWSESVNWKLRCRSELPIIVCTM
jgi:hypothetical protein